MVFYIHSATIDSPQAELKSRHLLMEKWLQIAFLKDELLKLLLDRYGHKEWMRVRLFLRIGNFCCVRAQACVMPGVDWPTLDVVASVD